MHIWFACRAHMEDGTSVTFRQGVELPDVTDLRLSADTLEEVEDLFAQRLVDAGLEAAEVHVLSWQEYGG